jgi:hypothetical protein
MHEIKPEILLKLGTYNSQINECIIDAVQHYQEKLSSESHIISKATSANYIRDHIVENAKKRFSSDPFVDIITKKMMVVFLFHTNPIIVLKFKKFNKYYRVSYSRSFQSMKYSNQYELFPDYGKTVHLHVGYKWNETETQVECLFGYPNSITGHAWTEIIPESEKIPFVEEKTIFEEEKTKPTVKLKVKNIQDVHAKTS